MTTALINFCAAVPAADLRVVDHDGSGNGVDVGTAVEHFGTRLAGVQVGPSQGADDERGAYDWWPLTLDGEPAGELRDDAAGITIHVGAGIVRPAIRSAGYIVADNEGVIHGYGTTADAAWEDMRRTMAAARIHLLSEDDDSTEQLGSWTRESGLKIEAASAALLREVEERGGAITWMRHGGVAGTPAEIEG